MSRAIGHQTLRDLARHDALLVRTAARHRKNAYAPYSSFTVGAAVRTRRGRVHAGANMENASYGLTICAEVSALSRATTDGDAKGVEAIAVVGGPRRGSARSLVTPCGRCRQLILEASHLAGRPIRVICCSGDLRTIVVATIEDLLPFGFGPDNLES